MWNIYMNNVHIYLLYFKGIYIYKEQFMITSLKIYNACMNRYSFYNKTRKGLYFSYIFIRNLLKQLILYQIFVP